MGKFKLLVAGFALVATGAMSLGAQVEAGAVTAVGGGTAVADNLWCC